MPSSIIPQTQASRLAQEEAETAAVVKHCPGCQQTILKADVGCNAMRCVCGCFFCWLCGEESEDCWCHENVRGCWHVYAGYVAPDHGAINGKFGDFCASIFDSFGRFLGVLGAWIPSWSRVGSTLKQIYDIWDRWLEPYFPCLILCMRIHAIIGMVSLARSFAERHSYWQEDIAYDGLGDFAEICSARRLRSGALAYIAIL